MTDNMNDWEKELSEAEEAWRAGNDGRARACCRRAVGVVLKAADIYSEKHNKNQCALDRIRTFSENSDVPEKVRKAAVRLTTNVRDRLSPDFTFHPLLDAKMIIDYLLSFDRGDQDI